MKILVIDNVNYFDYPTGGIMSFYRSLLPAFGNDLRLAGITIDNSIPVGKWSKREILGVTYDYFAMAKVTPNAKKPLIPERITNCMHVKKYIKRIINGIDFDVILTQTPEVMYFIPEKYLSCTCNILPGVGSPIVISRYPWARRFAKHYDRFFQMPKAAKAKWLLAAADKNARQKFANRSNGLIQADQIIQFPTRYDANIYYPYTKETRSAIRHNILHVKDTDPVFVTVGRLGWFKGWKLMIDAFRIVFNTQTSSKLFIIGDGEDEQKIQRYIAELKFQGHVILVGKKTPKEIAQYLNAADTFIMGSMAEGWSTTLVEACACGTPCVVTDFSSAREMTSDGVNGFVVQAYKLVGKERKLIDGAIEVFADKMQQSLSMDRQKVIEYDQKFEKFATKYLKKDLLEILSH